MALIFTMLQSGPSYGSWQWQENWWLSLEDRRVAPRQGSGRGDLDLHL